MKKLYSLLLIALIAGCEVDDNLESTNRYLKSIEVVSLPTLQYDTDGSPPDLRVDLKRRSTNFWEFSTETVNNAGNLPVFLNFPAEILATDEIYEIRIVDEDPNQPADYEIFYWTFQAVEDGDNGEIPFFDNGREVMWINFNLK